MISITAGVNVRTRPRPRAATMDRAAVQAVVIGAGPAGLAVAACLRRRGIPFAHFEAASALAPTWRRHYDRLHLHTHRSSSGLPYRPWPRSAPPYPSRDEVLAYLEDYARHFALQPRLGTPVRRVGAAAGGGGWIVQADDGEVRVRHVVIATGLNAVPNVPDRPDRGAFRGRVLHAASYRDGEPFRGQRVLVIGFGNSGAEIALDLHEHGARPIVSIRGTANLSPRALLGVPVEWIGGVTERLPPRAASVAERAVRNWVFGDLARHGVRLAPEGPSQGVRGRGRVPVIDVGTAAAIRRREVVVRPAVEVFREDGVEFVDGSHEEVDAVVLATGYRPSAARLFGASDDGFPPAGRGLHACGFTPSAGGMLRRISGEARAIAARIAAG